MSYQALARKWRPRRFTDVVGQAHVVGALTTALEQNRVHHAFLFTGTRGVGKTTLARLLAKALNCEQAPCAEPCGSCPACTGVDEGRYIDLLKSMPPRGLESTIPEKSWTTCSTPRPWAAIRSI